MTHIIRDQDAQRSQAASAMATHGRHDLHHRDTHWLAAGGLTSPGAISPGVESVKSWLPGIGSESDSPSGNHKQAEGQGFFSPMTKVYIGDVTDHLETVVSSMDQFVATCDHLTDYVFVSGDGDGLRRLMEIVRVIEHAVIPNECLDGTA